MELPKRLLHISPLYHRLRRPTASTRNISPKRPQPLQQFSRPFTTTTPTNESERLSGYSPLSASTFAPRAAPDYAKPTPPTPPTNPNAYSVNGTAAPEYAAASHHFHVYATKHNTHITLTDTRRVPLISVSSGSIGFRKAQRGSYDAAYQLGGYMLNRIQEQGLVPQIERCELVFRGFGPGREALAKILISAEGGALRRKWTRVVDATRLKFGGQRSKKPRRLG